MRYFLYVLLLISIILLYESRKLYYPLGYNTNTFIYLLTIGFGLAQYILVEKNKKDQSFTIFKSPQQTFLILFLMDLSPFIIMLGSLFFGFDFDDTVLLETNKYRVVDIYDVPTSGGRFYYAILKKEIISENCIYKSQNYERLDQPVIMQINGEDVLVAQNDTSSEKKHIYFLQKKPLLKTID
jgi:hypothetical protein